MRSFPSFKRQKNFTGLYYAATMGAHVGFESWLERDVAMMLDFDSRVVAFSSQPFWLGWSEDGEERQHAPDFFARLADGTGAVIDVRPDDRIKPRDARAFVVAEAACQQVGWVYQRTAGPGVALGANLRWLAGVLYHLLWRQELITDVTASLLGPRSVVSVAPEGRAGG